MFPGNITLSQGVPDVIVLPMLLGEISSVKLDVFEMPLHCFVPMLMRTSLTCF